MLGLFEKRKNAEQYDLLSKTCITDGYFSNLRKPIFRDKLIYNFTE